MHEILQWVLSEEGARCCVCTTHDWETVMRRVEHEGLSFLTITLPTYCRDFELSLDSGEVAPSRFSPWRKRGRLPLFLGGFLELVFDRNTGALLDVPSIESILAIRQISLLYKSVQLDCTNGRIIRAFKKYVETDKSVSDWDNGDNAALRDTFRHISSQLWTDCLLPVDACVYRGDVIPKHGPGATAERLTSNGKYLNRVWTERLESYFPSGEFLYPSWSHCLNDPSDVTYLSPGQELPVRVVSVPKTLKTPRIIGIEPSWMQYVQQGISELLVQALGRHDYLPNLIGFDDQSLNQDMALRGSLNGSLATLDLSEASDRVSNLLVMDLFANVRHLSGGVQACRSLTADVPGSGIISLSKFASMGSALCFPVEAMVFATIIATCLPSAKSSRLSKRDKFILSTQVRVYGDDIIVPLDMAPLVAERLEAYGLLVNYDKSFWTGKFRESCGKEYYDGHDVSVVKVRRALPTRRAHVPELEALVSFRNRCYWAGLWLTASRLDEMIGRLIPFPVVESTSQALGRQSALGHESQRFCQFLHRPLVKACVRTDKIPSDPLDGVGALMKVFLRRGMQPHADDEHLERAGRPRSVSIKTRWVLSD